MTPESWAVLGSLIERFGLPAVIVGIVALAFYRRWIVTRGELDDKQAELSKMELLYERERADRITAEQTLLKGTGTTAELAQTVAELSETVISRLPTPYDERLEGTRRRGR